MVRAEAARPFRDQVVTREAPRAREVSEVTEGRSAHAGMSILGRLRFRPVRAQKVISGIGLVIALTLAGCGGDGNANPRSGPSSSTPTSSPSSSKPRSSPTSKLVAYRGDEFTVSMPGKPRTSMQRLSTAVGKLTLHLLVVDGSSGSYLVGYSDYPRGTQPSIEGGVQGAATNIGADVP